MSDTMGSPFFPGRISISLNPIRSTFPVERIHFFMASLAAKRPA